MMAKFIGIEVGGVDATLRKLTEISDGERSIAVASVSAGLRVFAQASRDASPGTIKDETGSYLKIAGKKVWGRAGLVKFPRRGDGQDGPHGVYLELGTKFISPRGFIRSALQSAMPSARAAMRRAAEQRIAKLSRR